MFWMMKACLTTKRLPIWSAF